MNRRSFFHALIGATAAAPAIRATAAASKTYTPQPYGVGFTIKASSIRAGTLSFIDSAPLSRICDKRFCMLYVSVGGDGGPPLCYEVPAYQVADWRQIETNCNKLQPNRGGANP